MALFTAESGFQIYPLSMREPVIRKPDSDVSEAGTTPSSGLPPFLEDVLPTRCSG